MPAVTRARARGISELTSAALIALIVLVVGGFAVSKIVNMLASQKQDISREVVEQLAQAREALSSPFAYYSDALGKLYVAVATGDYPVKPYAVYVNETPATSSCIIRDSRGNTYSVGDYTIPPYSIAVIECSVSAGNLYRVTVLYEGGRLQVAAAKT